MQNKIIRQYYILSLLFTSFGISLIAATYVTFLIKNGLNLFEVNLVNAIFFLTLFICEIPTGAFADIFGRKNSFIASCALMGLSMFIYGYSRGFWGFIVAEIVGAIGATFSTGAFQAWLVDSLKHHDYEGDYSKIFARENLLSGIGGGFGAILGSYVAIINPSLPWFIGGSSLTIIAMIAHSIMKEEYFKRGNFSFSQGLLSMKAITITSLHYGLNHKPVRFVLIVTCIQIFSTQALNMYWQPYFKSRNVEEKNLGYIFVCITIAIAIGSLLISRFGSGSKEKSLLLKLQILTGISILATVFSVGLVPILIFFLIHEITRGCWKPVLDNYLQKQIPSTERATITSFCAMAHHIGGAIGLVVTGVIAELYGIKVAWCISGIVFIFGSLLVIRNGDHKTN